METKNYSMFKYISENRSINEGLVQRLINSINEIGYVKGRPILVNKNFMIIDGQHRLEACKRLGINVYYEIININTHKAILALNNNQQVWRLSDYVDSWASKNIECHKYIKEYENKYKFGISASIEICIKNNGNKINELKKGIDNAINIKSNDIGEFITQCKKYIGHYKTLNFVRAVVYMFNRTNDENCVRVLNKIGIVKKQASSADYLAIFENIINKNKKEKVILLINK